MKKFVKILALVICAVILVGVTGCGNTGYSKSKNVNSVEVVEFLTGKIYYRKTGNELGKRDTHEAKNYTELFEAVVGGTDLGIPFYNSQNETMYLLFGDTFGDSSATGNWRSSVMSYSTDWDLSDGLLFDGYYSSSNGYAKAVIEGKHDNNDAYGEVTKIPQGGIEVNGVVYIYYESIRHWGEPGYWDVNYQGVIKSTDNCESFERVYDLTWFSSTDDQYIEASKEYAEQDVSGNDSGVDIDVEGREAPYFEQCYPVDGKDGYVYIFGRRAGRQHGIKVARVSYANIEKFDEHEYYCGNDNDGNAIWKKGREGLAGLNNDTVGLIVKEPASNMSVMWNEYLGKWMLVYLKAESKNIVYRLSDTIWGNYGDYNVILEKDFFTEDGVNHEVLGVEWSFDKSNSVVYGAFVHEKYQEENGKSFYLILSITDPIYNTLLFKVNLK